MESAVACYIACQRRERKTLSLSLDIRCSLPAVLRDAASVCAAACLLFQQVFSVLALLTSSLPIPGIVGVSAIREATSPVMVEITG